MYTLAMRSARFKSFIAILFVLTACFTLQNSVLAQSSSLGVSRYYKVDGEVFDGDLIGIYEGKYQKTIFRYQPNVVGVYVENPTLEFRPEDTTDMKAVLSTGEAYVNVSSINGPIRVNEYVTTSEIPGVGMLATVKGPVIGTALEDFDESDPNKIGRIRVTLYIQDTGSSALAIGGEGGVNLLDVFSASKLALYQSPSDSFKYIVAAVVVMISFVFGFITFRKVAVKGVEAIGRNPLASRVIGIGILLNLIITVSIIIAGLILAYFIVTL